MLVKEAISDVLKGPSKEEIEHKSKGLAPQELLDKGLKNDIPAWIKRALDSGAKIKRAWDIVQVKRLLKIEDINDLGQYIQSDALKLNFGIKGKYKPNQRFANALEKSDDNEMLKAIKTGADNIKISNEEAVIIAATKGNAPLLKALLKAGADPTAGGIRGYRYGGDSYENAALRYACEMGHLNIVRILLADNRVDGSYPRDNALKAAYKYKQWKVLLELLKHDYIISQGHKTIKKIMDELIKEKE